MTRMTGSKRDLSQPRFPVGPHQDRNPWDPKTALAGYHPPSTVCSRPDKNLDVVVADTPEPVSQTWLGEIDGNPEMEALLLGKSSINGNTIPRININLQLEVVR